MVSNDLPSELLFTISSSILHASSISDNLFIAAAPEFIMLPKTLSVILQAFFILEISTSSLTILKFSTAPSIFTSFLSCPDNNFSSLLKPVKLIFFPSTPIELKL